VSPGTPGVDVADHRGRTGLHQVGRDLDGNANVVVRDVEITGLGWHVLRRRPYTPAARVGGGGGLAEEGEDIEVFELPLAEALDMIDDGRISDAKTMILLQSAALRGPFRLR
jgi:8-oxo-dGTP pyrophosphatase MutT (NUDIX family)